MGAGREERAGERLAETGLVRKVTSPTMEVCLAGRKGETLIKALRVVEREEVLKGGE